MIDFISFALLLYTCMYDFSFNVVKNDTLNYDKQVCIRGFNACHFFRGSKPLSLSFESKRKLRVVEEIWEVQLLQQRNAVAFFFNIIIQPVMPWVCGMNHSYVRLNPEDEAACCLCKDFFFVVNFYMLKRHMRQECFDIQACQLYKEHN